MFPEYPYMNFQDLNLDFILKRIKELTSSSQIKMPNKCLGLEVNYESSIL